MTPTNYPQIIDGFCFSGLYGLRPLNTSSWYWACLSNLEDLRIAADSYRSRQWVVPKNFIDTNNPNNGNILPGKTVFYEFQVKEGSWLYGMQFANQFFPNVTQAKFSVVVRQGTDLAFMDRPIAASEIYSGDPIDPFNTLKPPVNLLPKPRLIVPPTQLHVEISNDGDPTDPDNFCQGVQLILLFAEPK